MGIIGILLMIIIKLRILLKRMLNCFMTTIKLSRESEYEVNIEIKLTHILFIYVTHLNYGLLLHKNTSKDIRRLLLFIIGSF